MIKVSHRGSFEKTTRFLSKKNTDFLRILHAHGEKGVELLKNNTPKDTGLTADSWKYSIKQGARGLYSIEWHNTNLTETGVPVAILIQYGHATLGGSYVDGIDYINPVISQVFKEMIKQIEKEVQK